MDRLEAVENFVAVAEAGSFVGAARRLGRSPAAMTRAVASLEDRLGIRLFNRTKAEWVGDYVHESVRVSGRIGHLEGNLLHFTCDSLSQHLRTLDSYTTLAAQQMIDQKRQIGWSKLLLDPPWTFFRTYFLQRGFLDGAEGLAIAYMAAYYNFLKYAKARFLTGR